jgi:PPK2 family polyphosphate:nucleotide phosphotransferase
VAKPGGKTDSMRAAKRADEDKALRKSGKAKAGGKLRSKDDKVRAAKGGSTQTAAAQAVVTATVPAKTLSNKKAASKAVPGKAVSAKAASGKAGSAKTRSKVKSAKPPKVAKSKQLKGAEQLVEKVAAQIVAAEFDRVLEENRRGAESSGPENSGPESGAESAAAVAEQTVLEPEAAETADAAEPDAAEPEAAETAQEPTQSEATQSEATEAEATQTEAAEPAAVGATAVPVQAAESEKKPEDRPFDELLRVPAGPVDLAEYDPSRTPGVESRAHAEAQLAGLTARLNELQERLFAAGRGGGNQRVLLVLQGMDTSGKGGTVRHVVGNLDPNGVRLTAFKAPTEEERAHDFLWRIRAALPHAGEVGIFDRSHYEDVLIGRVRKLALPMVIGRRYILINKFEQGLVDDGCVVVKCFLHIGPDEQRDRLLARLDNPNKHWKYSPSDVDDRLLWPEYQDAYRIALEKTSTEAAPWHVIPANRKWYRNYAITRLLVEALERIDPKYPVGDFDAAAERERVLAS